MDKTKELLDIGGPIILEELPRDKVMKKSEKLPEASDSSRECPNLISKVSARFFHVSKRAA